MHTNRQAIYRQYEWINVHDKGFSCTYKYLYLIFIFSTTQLELPATGALAPRPQVEEATKHFLAWTHHRTKQNWKFSLFTKVIEPWFQTYQKSVSVSGSQEFRNSIFLWLEDHCSLRVLRPSKRVFLPLKFASTAI